MHFQKNNKAIGCGQGRPIRRRKHLPQQNHFDFDKKGLTNNSLGVTWK